MSKAQKIKFSMVNFWSKMAKIYYSLPWQPFCFKRKTNLISLVYPTKHIIYQNLGEIAEIPCPTLFGGYVDRLLISVWCLEQDVEFDCIGS